jgi:diguanylate cyclase (GGDEF)-like protein
VCVAVIDLDEFKHFNDEHGHQAGDALLSEAARAWQGQLRASDLLARYGGEESRQ